jgi:hypothetical protein
MQTYNVDRVDPDRRARIEAAEVDLRELSKLLSFHKWMTVGIGVNEMEQAAMDLAGSQDNQSHVYRQAWRSLAARYPHLAELSKNERSLASWMATNREVIEAWHARLDDRKRRNINTPRAVYNNHPLGKAARAERNEPRRVRPPAATKDDLTEATQMISEELTRVSGPSAMFDLSPEHLAASVENFLAIYGEQEARAFAIALLDRTALRTVPSATEVLLQEDAMLKRKPRRGLKPLDDPTRPRNRANGKGGRPLKHPWNLLAAVDDSVVVDLPPELAFNLANNYLRRHGGGKCSTHKLSDHQTEVTRVA